MKNQVIKNLNPEMGKEIIKYWQSLGVNTGLLIGSSIHEHTECFYYGVINNKFGAYSKRAVQLDNAEIIELPKKLFSIQDLADGKCAAENDGTLEELKQVLSLSFPNCKDIPTGKTRFYKLWEQGKWGGYFVIDKPVQSVKDFLPIDMFKEFKEAHKRGEIIQQLCGFTEVWHDVSNPDWMPLSKYRIKPTEEWKPKRGETVLVRDHENNIWKPLIYLETIEGSSIPYIVVYESDVEAFNNGSEFSHLAYRYMKQKPVTVELTKEQIAIKFGIELEQLIIKG